MTDLQRKSSIAIVSPKGVKTKYVFKLTVYFFKDEEDPRKAKMNFWVTLMEGEEDGEIKIKEGSKLIAWKDATIESDTLIEEIETLGKNLAVLFGWEKDES